MSSCTRRAGTSRHRPSVSAKCERRARCHTGRMLPTAPRQLQLLCRCLETSSKVLDFRSERCHTVCIRGVRHPIDQAQMARRAVRHGITNSSPVARALTSIPFGASPLEFGHDPAALHSGHLALHPRCGCIVFARCHPRMDTASCDNADDTPNQEPRRQHTQDETRHAVLTVEC